MKSNERGFVAILLAMTPIWTWRVGDTWHAQIGGARGTGPSARAATIRALLQLRQAQRDGAAPGPGPGPFTLPVAADEVDESAVQWVELAGTGNANGATT